MKKVFAVLVIFGQSLLNAAYCQDDPSANDTVEGGGFNKKIAVFRNNKIVNAQSCETLKKQHFNFSINGRLNYLLEQDGTGGFHQFFGFDEWNDSRLSLDYGITNRIQAGIGRSFKYENIDGTIKIKVFEQKESGMPFTLTWYSNASFSAMSDMDFYSDADSAWVAANSYLAHRFAYTHQVIIGRQFCPRFALEILPVFNYRNLVYPYVNPANGAAETNILYSVGTAARIQLAENIAFLADYFYIISKFREKNPDMPFYHPLAAGIEICSGKHVFNLNCSNTSAVIENSFLPNTIDSWKKGTVKLGFSVSRIFGINKKG